MDLSYLYCIIFAFVFTLISYFVFRRILKNKILLGLILSFIFAVCLDTAIYNYNHMWDDYLRIHSPTSLESGRFNANKGLLESLVDKMSEILGRFGNANYK